jgi:hypothetical protein
MVEIALCLAVVAFALVAIIGVLPTGLRVQKDNREDTILNQDGTLLIEAIRSQSQALDYLTNYFVSIMVTNRLQTVVYTQPGTPATFFPTGAQIRPTLTNGVSIIRLLSGPKYSGTETNSVTAHVRAISGSAAEKSKSGRDFAFAYLLKSEVIPLSTFPTPQTNEIILRRTWFNQVANFSQVTLTLQGPLLQKGNRLEAIGIPKTFRAVVAGAWTNSGDFGEFKPNIFRQEL